MKGGDDTLPIDVSSKFTLLNATAKNIGGTIMLCGCNRELQATGEVATCDFTPRRYQSQNLVGFTWRHHVVAQ